jgi:hypothetical protein
MTTITTTEPRPPVPDVTWDTFRERGITVQTQVPGGWQVETDLAYALADHIEHINVHTARVLVAAANRSLPVTLTWRADDGHASTATVIITSLTGPCDCAPHGPVPCLAYPGRKGEDRIPLACLQTATLALGSTR